jgi:hypothetical protein
MEVVSIARHSRCRLRESRLHPDAGLYLARFELDRSDEVDLGCMPICPTHGRVGLWQYRPTMALFAIVLSRGTSCVGGRTQEEPAMYQHNVQLYAVLLF